MLTELTFLSHLALAFAQCTQAIGIRSVGESILLDSYEEGIQWGIIWRVEVKLLVVIGPISYLRTCVLDGP